MYFSFLRLCFGGRIYTMTSSHYKVTNSRNYLQKFSMLRQQTLSKLAFTTISSSLNRAQQQGKKEEKLMT